MKFILEQSDKYSEVEITVKCNIIDDKLKQLIGQIRLYSFSVIGRRDGESIVIPIEEVYYFESVDNKTFIYLKSDVLESDKKLYELEETLADTRFLRISKSTILNVEQLKSVKALLNGKYEATLKNGEKLIINRHYVSDFKAHFNLGRN